MTRQGAGWQLHTSGGAASADFCIVAMGARNPLREVGTELKPRDTMTALDTTSRRSGRIDLQFLPGLEGYIWIFRAAATFRWNLRQRRASGGAAPAAGAVHDGARYFAQRWHVLFAPAAFARQRLLAGEPRGRRWLDGGGRFGRLVDPLTGEGLYYAIRSADLRRAHCWPKWRPGGETGALPRAAAPRFAADLEFGAHLAKRFFVGRFCAEQ